MKKEKIKIKRYYSSSVIGVCNTCGKDFQDYLKPRQGYIHAKKTGHSVRMEISSVVHYN